MGWFAGVAYAASLLLPEVSGQIATDVAFSCEIASARSQILLALLFPTSPGPTCAKQTMFRNININLITRWNINVKVLMNAEVNFSIIAYSMSFLKRKQHL